MSKKKGSQPLTLIVVPHDERPPISFRFPTWLVPLLSLLTVTTVAGFAVVGAHSLRLAQEVAALRQDRQLQQAREREMRSTILVQQDEVRGLSSLVSGFETELASVNNLSAEVREIIGLPAPESTPEPLVTTYSEAAYRSMAADARLSTAGYEGRGGGLTAEISDKGMDAAVEQSQQIIEMQNAVPSMLRELAELRDEVLVRMAKIEPEKRTNLDDLEFQLRLLAAAPHRWPTDIRRISSKFGYRSLLGKLEFHNGIDIPMWFGTQVLATADGVVISAGWDGGLGWAVEVQHEMGFTTTYGHTSKLLVKKGDEVKAGEAIALSGNSGRSTGPHLHYEMRLNNIPVDPLKYLDADRPYVIEK